jgi:hypothetical protein
VSPYRQTKLEKLQGETRTVSRAVFADVGQSEEARGS